MNYNMKNNNRQKMIVMVMAILMIFSIPSIFAAGVVSHAGDDVYVSYGGSQLSAQTAMTNLVNAAQTMRTALSAKCSYANGVSFSVPAASPSGNSGSTGHLGSQVKVTINGVTTTVQQVVSTIDAALSSLEANCAAEIAAAAAAATAPVTQAPAPVTETQTQTTTETTETQTQPDAATQTPEDTTPVQTETSNPTGGDATPSSSGGGYSNPWYDPFGWFGFGDEQVIQPGFGNELN